ncbi:cysteine synthase family protein [Sorangium sp. So ce1504]|uniref:PLP-dependent cysteine synthase family protein n=1 Tax=Sorangium sp. So ce1504 TaxID=3133337 RepID=UPI003F60140C
MKTILDAIGETPLLRFDGVHVKCEYLNPSGSIKDRLARYIIEKAEKEGLLKKGATIVEASSGNTGAAVSMVGAVKGYKVTIFIAEGLSEERYKMMRAFGADVRTVPRDRMDIAVQRASALGKEKGHFHVNQFANPWNAQDHDEHLGGEILRASGRRRIDAVVAAIGSGGTLIGLARAFRRVNPEVQVFGVEPARCALVYGRLRGRPEVCRPHRIEGIGEGFVPPLIEDNIELIDDVIRVEDGEAIEEARRIARVHGCFVGVSSGANLLAARRVKEKSPALRNVVTLFPDEGEKYLSERWFSR